MQEDGRELLESTPRPLVYRLACFALSPSRHLDLSNLPPTITPTLDTLDLPFLLDVFGTPSTSITVLNLSSNPLERLPQWICGMSELERLDVSDTWVEYLPIGMIRLPLQRIKMRNTSLDIGLPSRSVSRDKVYKLEFKNLRRNPRSGVPSLVSCASTVALMYGIPSDGLPPHLAELIDASYICELCALPQLPSSPSYIRQQVSFAWAAQPGRVLRRSVGRCGKRWTETKTQGEKRVKVSGRICSSCYSGLRTLKPRLDAPVPDCISWTTSDHYASRTTSVLTN